MEKEKEEITKNETSAHDSEMPMHQPKEIKVDEMEHGGMNSGSYRKFALMILVSFFTMYIVMFLNADKFDHVYMSLMRIYMTILMICPMAITMLLFMKGMYKNQKINAGILAGSILVFAFTFYFVRTQAFIGDKQWMRAMIPHHSSAILTSSEADLSDPEVKELADEIIKAQEKEIALMKRLLEKSDR